MKKTSLSQTPQFRVPIAAGLTWLLPGAGHVFVGERARGLIIMVGIAATFWAGVAIGGVKYTVDRDGRKLWFIGQICAGGHTLATMAIGSGVKPGPDENEDDLRAFNRAEEVSVVYTTICGMLTVLVLLDVLVRAEKRPARPRDHRGPPGGKRGRSP